MTKKSTKKKALSGGARLMGGGLKPIVCGMTPAEHELLRRAAEAEHRPMTQFLLFYGLAAAEKILKKRDE